MTLSMLHSLPDETMRVRSINGSSKLKFLREKIDLMRMGACLAPRRWRFLGQLTSRLLQRRWKIQFRRKGATGALLIAYPLTPTSPQRPQGKVMNKAFVKEDDQQADALPDHLFPPHANLVTERGLSLLKQKSRASKRHGRLPNWPTSRQLALSGICTTGASGKPRQTWLSRRATSACSSDQE
jgi:hypothetical protein